MLSTIDYSYFAISLLPYPYYSKIVSKFPVFGTVFTFISLSTALTTLSNLGGCVTDYRTLYIALFYRRITLFWTRISLPFYLVIYTFFHVFIPLNFYRLQSSRSCKSSHCKAYIYYPIYKVYNTHFFLFSFVFKDYFNLQVIN